MPAVSPAWQIISRRGAQPSCFPHSQPSLLTYVAFLAPVGICSQTCYERVPGKAISYIQTCTRHPARCFTNTITYTLMTVTLIPHQGSQMTGLWSLNQKVAELELFRVTAMEHWAEFQRPGFQLS